MKTTKPIKPLLIALTLVFALSGCNTFAGFGEDVEAVGEQIEECAEGVDC